LEKCICTSTRKDDQLKIFVEKKYAELPAALRYEIETNGKNYDLK
jgi:hypothetical protein